MKDVSDRMGGFFGTTVARPVALMVLFITLIVVGVIGYQRIPLLLFPSGFSEPGLYVYIENQGASARENEERIARVVEEQLRTLTGIEEVVSRSSDGSVELEIGFDGSIDIDLAKAEVRDRLERARPLMPSTASNAFMWAQSMDDLPITFFGILLRGDPDEHPHMVEKVIQPRLDAVPGIGRVSMWGVLQDSVRILLDEEKVAAAQLDLGALIGRLSSDNFAMPLGELDDGGNEIFLRSDMRFGSLEEIEDYPIGGGLKVRDVGKVERVKSVGNSLSRINGGFAYEGMAMKDSQSNVVEVSRDFRAALEELESDPALEGKMSSIMFFLQGDMIEGALNQLRETAMWGGLLALLVLFVFLRRIRLTICVALSIPVSILMALLWEYAWGGSFNVLTMVGITLGIGMLVDNAVVVVENIAREHREGGSPHEAAVRGSAQIALAITLATLTTVVVFLPLIFMTGNQMVRVIFGGIGIPLSVSLISSLLIAVVFLPVITARLLGERVGPMEWVAARVAPVLRLPVRGFAYVVGFLLACWHVLLRGLFAANRFCLAVLTPLRWVLAIAAVGIVAWRIIELDVTTPPLESLAEFGLDSAIPRWLVLGIVKGALMLLALVGVALALSGLKRWKRRSVAPPAWPTRLVPVGGSLIDMTTESNGRLVEWTLRHRLAASGLAVLAMASVIVPKLGMDITPFGQDSYEDRVSFVVVFNDDFTLEEAADEVAVYEEFLDSKREEFGFDNWKNRFDETDARLTIYWDALPGEAEIQRVRKALRDGLPRIPGHALHFYDREEMSDRSRKITTFILNGPDSQELERLGLMAMEVLEKIHGLSQISSDLENAPEQIRVEVDRDRASNLGVNTQAIQQTISYVLAGFPLPRFQEKGREVPFLIEYDSEDVAGLPTLRDMNVFSETGAVPLSSVADLSYAKGSNFIRRKNGKITFTIWAEVDDPLKIIPITEAGYAALAQLDLPRGYSIGQKDSALARQEEETLELLKALGFAIVLVFLFMAILFESLLLPFSVLCTVPFAAVGAFWTLFLTQTPMDSMGWIGLIILSGVVVNNGIVLIDRIHGLRARGMERAEAVVAGCRHRVRPVLMTALTTVGGLTPMILTPPPPNSFDYRTLATIVAGGLVASTFFTLWVVPLAYTLLDDLAVLLRDRFRWWLRRGNTVSDTFLPPSQSGNTASDTFLPPSQ